MKKKLLALALLTAGGSVFAGPGVSIGINLGGHGRSNYAPAPHGVAGPGYAGSGYSYQAPVNSYYVPNGGYSNGHGSTSYGSNGHGSTSYGSGGHGSSYYGGGGGSSYGGGHGSSYYGGGRSSSYSSH